MTASDLHQTVEEKEFFGFKYSDIFQFRLDRMVLWCRFCGGSAPSIYCVECGIRYHLPCGIEKGCVTIMTGEFHNYCNRCYELRYPGLLKKSSKGSCFMCCEKFDGTELLYTPKCCNPDLMMHISCLKVSKLIRFLCSVPIGYTLKVLLNKIYHLSYCEFHNTIYYLCLRQLIFK